MNCLLQLVAIAMVTFLLIPSADGQSERPKPDANAISQSPWWAQQMYSPLPDIHQVDSAFSIWRKQNPAEQTYHTKYYKHWRKAIGSYISPSGHQQLPVSEEQKETLRKWLEIRELDAARSTTWQSVGPFETIAEGTNLPVSWQANVYCFDQGLSDPDTLYCGTEGGSIFRTADKGANWSCVSDQLNLGGIGAVKVDPTNAMIVYFGQGDDLYQTTDGGASWTSILTHSGLNPRDISINPSDNQIIIVAGAGGLHRTDNGGSTWTEIYPAPCWDVEIKTDDSATLFLLKKSPTTNICEFFKSTDFGASWTLKDSGWIDPTANDIADNEDNGARLAVTDADPNRIYAALIGHYNDNDNDNNYLGVYRSDDAGESWTLPNANASGGPGGPWAGAHSCLVTFWFNNDQKYPNNSSEYNQGFYNMGLAASDSDPDAFIVGFLNLFKSEDGGITFTQWGGYGGGPGWQHPDIQDIDINGADTWVCSDGGINLYSADFSSHDALNNGLAASDYWGFDGGWNEDIVTGGRYHNGNTASILGTYPSGQYIRLGGAEETTGYVHPAGGRKVMHSDINPKVLPTTVTGPTSGFSFTAYPNEGYAGNNENSSEIEPDPRCYNHLYMGSEHQLLKSEDGGLSWSALYSFGSDASKMVTGIEVSRSNPDVIYCVHKSTPTTLHRSDDGGQTFTPVNSPPGATNNGAFITLSATDENKIWLAWSVGGNNSNKVFESTDGGNSWTNLTTSLLDGHYTEQILHIGGTDDGVYWASDYGVFYRSDSETDWLACSNNLPVRARINRLVPFYADSKIRIATYNRGVWESEFAEAPAQPIVQPTVDKLISYCSRDTFYFDDYSMVDHGTAIWSWAFNPAPDYISNSNVRNPKVVFGSMGDFTATLTLNGAYSKDISVHVGSGCEADSIPGNALSLDPSGYAVAADNLELNTNTVSITCWVKAAETQNDRAVFAFWRGGTTVTGIGFSTGRKLSYHYDGSQWWWDPNLEVPADTWTHVALVVTPTEATIYLNGVGVSNTTGHSPEAFDTPMYLGWDTNSAARRFTGLLDEVTVWKKALSQNEVRELMHLTLVPGDHPDLVAYYQINEMTGQILDRTGTRHLAIGGSGGRTSSTTPIGWGTSNRQTVNAAGAYAFGSTGITMTFAPSGTYPDGELCATRINLDPDQLPNANPNSDAYWVVNNYGSNTVFTELESIRFDDYGSIPTGDLAANYSLYKRSSFAEGATWGGILDLGDELVTGDPGSVTFSTGNGVTDFSQLVVVNDLPLPVEWQDFLVGLRSDKTVRLYWSVYQDNQVAYFDIERSSDGRQFEFLERVEAHTGVGDFQYEASDPSPFRGVSYYRLRQVDFDGSYRYSVIRSILINRLADEFALFPNPLFSGQQLEVKTNRADQYRLILYDQKGRIVYAKELLGDASLSELELAPGVYSWQILIPPQGGRRWVGKLLVR